MQKYLTPKAFNEVKSAINSDEKLSREQADVVADGMKRRAMDHGVTHYTHWFQPLTGRTAEKHDAFYSPSSGVSSIENFQG